jgi:hypothetical protein
MSTKESETRMPKIGPAPRRATCSGNPSKKRFLVESSADHTAVPVHHVLVPYHERKEMTA